MSDDNNPKPNPSTESNKPYNHDDEITREQDTMRLWGILIFAINQLRRTGDFFYSQFTRSQSSYRGGSSSSSSSSSSSRSSFQEEARKKYARRMQEEYEDEMERVERIRRMQSVFNREKNKFRRGYERWSEDSSDGYQQHFQRDDWYWKTEKMYGNRSNFKEPHQAPVNYSLSHHYAILGLSRSRTNPYTDDEIKIAFRNKAKQYHPDQNQENKGIGVHHQEKTLKKRKPKNTLRVRHPDEVAEARFKEIMSSYEAIKSERKNTIK